MKVGEIARKPVIVEEDIDLREAAKVLLSNKVDSFLYVKDDEVQGTISRNDLLKNFGRECEISEVMSKKFKKIPFTDSLESARKLLKDPDCNILIVEKKGALMGVVSAIDLIQDDDDPGDFVFE